jgi:hypothetical protein
MIGLNTKLVSSITSGQAAMPWQLKCVSIYSLSYPVKSQSLLS